MAPQSIQDMSISVCLRVFQCLEHGTQKVGGGFTYDFTGQNGTLLKKYPKSNFLDHDSMFFGFSAPKIGQVLMKTFSKGSFTRFFQKMAPGGGGHLPDFTQTWH